MTNHDDFLRAILADLEDETVRLVFADWLEERGEVHYAAWMRRVGSVSVQLGSITSTPYRSRVMWRVVLRDRLDSGAMAWNYISVDQDGLAQELSQARPQSVAAFCRRLAELAEAERRALTAGR